MYQLEEIEKIVQDVVKKLKTYDMRSGYMRTGEHGKVPWKDIPEFWPGYKQALKYMQVIKVHAEIGDFPDELFRERAPNETDKEASYIRANYKQMTLPVFMDYISMMARPFFEGNYSINYQSEQWKDSYKGNKLQDYVEGEVTSVGSVENFMKMIVSQVKGIDANGVIAVRPKDIPVSVNDEGEAVVDNSEMFEPVPIYYSTDKKLAFEKNKYFLIKTDECSKVLYGGKMDEKGHIFEFYDDQNIWKIVQVGNFVDYKFEYYLFFEHGWGRVPVVDLMGVPQMLNSKDMIWISPFHYAVPNLNSALISTQYLNASKDRTMFPYLVMLGRPCMFEYKNEDDQISRCNGGSIYNTSTGQNMECPACKGSGQADRLSPFGVLYVNPDSEFNKGDGVSGQNAMYYVSANPESLKFYRECIQLDLDEARKILHQQTSNSVVKGTENLTATGQVLDNKSMFAFVKTPSDQLFSIWEFIYDAIGWQRYGEDYVKAILVSPDTFDYNTDQDYLIKIAEAQKAGLPPFVIHSIIFRYLQTLYYNERDRAEVFSLIINTDRILTISQQDIMLKFSRGLVKDWEVVLHDSAINLISELIVEDAGFLELDFIEKQNRLIDRAKSKTTQQATPQQSAVLRALA